MAALGRQNESIPVANRRETILGTIISFGMIAILAVILRLYARFRLAKRPGWDDLLAVLALTSVTTGSVFLCLATYSGLGQHMATLSAWQSSTYLFRFYIANATYALSTTLLKLSLLCQYLRIFDRGIIRAVIFTILAFCLVWGLVSSFMAWFPCFPVKAYWDRRITDATCYAFGSQDETSFVSTYVSHSAFNVLLDFAVLVLPAPIVFRQAMTRKEKFAALGLGTMGTLVIVMCTWRLGKVVQHQAGYKPYLDFTWWAPIMVTLASLEVNIGILAVSCPVFWPVIEEHFFGIIVRQEVHVTSQRMSGFDHLDDGDGKSEDGSQTALASEPARSLHAKGQQAYYTEELALEPIGLGQNDVTIRGREDARAS